MNPLLKFRDDIYKSWNGKYQINTNCTFWQLKEGDTHAKGSNLPSRGVCFGATAHGYDKYLGTIVAINYGGYNGNKPDKKKLEFWINYHVNESPFKECFLEHDMDVITKTELLVVNGKINGPLMQASISSLRQGWEQSQQVNSFWELCQAGMDHDWAFILCHFLYVKDGVMSVNPVGEGHNWAGYNTWTNFCVRNFLARNPKKYPEYYETGSWSGARAVFQHGATAKKVATYVQPRQLSDFIKNGMTVKAITTKTVNPFAKAMATTPTKVEYFKAPIKDMTKWLINNLDKIQEMFCG